MKGIAHPEDALERAISGTLSREERRSLEQHLAVCVACQAHLALAGVARESFQTQAGDAAADRVNVERALAFMARPVPARVSRLKKRLVWPAAAATLAMGGLAAAAWLGPRQTSAVVDAQAPAVSKLSADLASKLARAKAVASAPPSDAASPRLELEAPAAAPAPSAVLAELATASALFRKASALRANGESDAAIAVFQKLQRLFPRSRESELSLVVAGRLLLERGRPAPALAAFDRYLAESGAASEHALAGRAAALQSLGRNGAEASAWQRLLAVYPRSVYAQRAKTRLSELGAAPPSASSAP